MSFSRNAASYFPRPRLRSQTTMSMATPTIGGGVHHLLGKRGCPGWRWGFVIQMPWLTADARDTFWRRLLQPRMSSIGNKGAEAALSLRLMELPRIQRERGVKSHP
jgi:hypothetical protein